MIFPPSQPCRQNGRCQCLSPAWLGGRRGRNFFQPTQAQLSNHVLNTGDLITSLQRREKPATGSMKGQMDGVYTRMTNQARFPPPPPSLARTHPCVVRLWHRSLDSRLRPRSSLAGALWMGLLIYFCTAGSTTPWRNPLIIDSQTKRKESVFVGGWEEEVGQPEYGGVHQILDMREW